MVKTFWFNFSQKGPHSIITAHIQINLKAMIVIVIVTLIRTLQTRTPNHILIMTRFVISILMQEL